MIIRSIPGRKTTTSRELLWRLLRFLKPHQRELNSQQLSSALTKHPITTLLSLTSIRSHTQTTPDSYQLSSALTKHPITTLLSLTSIHSHTAHDQTTPDSYPPLYQFVFVFHFWLICVSIFVVGTYPRRDSTSSPQMSTCHFYRWPTCMNEQTT